jgi:hypothetical protein
MSVEALAEAVAGFVVEDLDLELDPAAVEAARRSVEESGLLLLGEVHGVRENPLLARALMRVFGLTRLALEWPDDLAPVIEAFQATGTLADHWLLWAGDGRITAGHLAVLAERAAAGPVQVVLFDGTIGAGWSWSDRDEAMAGRILSAGGRGGVCAIRDCHALMAAAGDGDGELPGDGGAVAGGGPDLQPAAERGEPVGHVPLARSHRGVAGVVAGAVVGHDEPQGSVLGLEADASVGCLGVFGGVLQRFEAAEVHGRLGVLPEAADPAGLDRHRQGGLAGLGVERRGQP